MEIIHWNLKAAVSKPTKAKCPIVPVALIDTYKAFDTGSIEPLTVQVHFLKPMYYDEYKDMKTTEIARRSETTSGRDHQRIWWMGLIEYLKCLKDI